MPKSAVLCILTLTTVQSLYIDQQCPQQCICVPNFTDCKYNSFSEVPTGLDPNVTVLDLSYNLFKHFPETLNYYPTLTYLNLSHNQIETLGVDAFKNLKNLERLDLTYNKFVDWMDITSNAFAGAKTLQFLDLSHNSLLNLPANKNSLSIPSLQILRLNNCSIGYFNAKILDKLPNLQELHLSGNPITYLGASFVSKSLKFLDLSGCKLNSVGYLIFRQLTELQTVYMGHNSDLKRFDCDSPSLKYLDLSDCNLEAIPSGNLPNMYAANFHGNHFRVIPKNSFKNYSKLEILDLSHSAIGTIEDGAFIGLNNIQRIDLSENTISNLNRDMFESNTNLRFLNLSRNYINRFQDFISDSLETLDLSVCEIPSVEFDALTDMRNLKILDLSKNRISVLPDNLRSDSLRELDVSLCRIKNVNNRTLVDLPSLRILNLAGNRLTTASPESFAQVISLDISDNPWRCDCLSLKPLYDWLSKTGKRLDGLYCQSPDIYEGMSWMSACQKDWHPIATAGDTIWWYTTGLIVTVFLILFVILAMRRMYLLKEKRMREATEARRAEEREALRRMQRVQAEAREEASRNAPDPRELQTPPPYNEALLLPRLDASHPSLAGSLHSLASKHSLNGSLPDVSKRGRPRRKRRRRKSDSSEGQRASRVVIESETSDPEPQPRTTLESDF